MTTYILPAAAWAILLGPIVKDARPGDTIECGTLGMFVLAVAALREAGREDVIVRLNVRKEQAA